jgi:hypothetical protein
MEVHWEWIKEGISGLPEKEGTAHFVGPGMSSVIQELPEPQDRVVSFGFSPDPRAMIWLVLLTTLSKDSDLHSGHCMSTVSSEFIKIFSKTWPQSTHRNSNIGIVMLLCLRLQHSSRQWYISTPLMFIVIGYRRFGMRSLYKISAGKSWIPTVWDLTRRTING